MLIEGEFRLKTTIQRAWDFLLRPGTLAACVPGCEKVEVIDDRTYDSIVKASVGPISVRFRFRTILAEMDPPRYVKATGSGEDLNKNGNFTQETIVNLRENSEGEVEVSYRTNISIAGRLTTFGDRIMRAKAKQVGEEFTQALSKRLLGEEVAVAAVKVSTVEVLATFFATLWQGIKRFFLSLMDKLKSKRSK